MFLLSAMPALAQSGVVEGSVIDAVTKAPIADAVVKLYREDKAVHSGASDARGLFRIEGVSHGEYRAVIDNSEHMRLASDHPAARTFVVSAANPEVRLRAELVPLGQVAGRVLSPTGDPMKGVPVGMRRLWDQQWTQITVSGDGGLFRFRRLEPGTWILAGLSSARISYAISAKDLKALGPPAADEGRRVGLYAGVLIDNNRFAPPAAEEGRGVGWAATFFPGVVDLAGAEKIVFRPGTVLEGYDIKLRTVPLRRLSGVVVDEDGKPAPKAVLSFTDLANQGANGATKTADDAGCFEFDSAMDGEWRIFAQAEPSGRRLKGYVDLHVSRRDVSGIEVRLTAPFQVKGFVDREEPPDKHGKRSVTALYLIPQGASPDAQEPTVHEQDGSFVLKNVYAGRYRVLPEGHVPGYYVASIWYGDQEVTTRAVDVVSPPLPLKIVYRSGAARVAGTVERGEGTWVVLVPQDEALRDPFQFIRTARCEAYGRFSIDSLRPGSYYAFAFDRVTREMLEDVGFVRKLVPHAVRVEVRHGETANLELRPQLWPDY
jgi:hypothetical protein